MLQGQTGPDQSWEVADPLWAVETQPTEPLVLLHRMYAEQKLEPGAKSGIPIQGLQPETSWPVVGTALTALLKATNSIMFMNLSTVLTPFLTNSF